MILQISKLERFCVLCILLYFVFCFFTCATGCKSIEKSIQDKRINKARYQFDQHPDSFASRCMYYFPVKDSTGQIIYVPADNKDYTLVIDSLIKADQSESQDSLIAACTILLDNSTSQVQEIFQSKLLKAEKEKADLKALIDKLHKDYKPCISDTVFATKYMVDGAAVVDANNKSESEKHSRIQTEAKNASLLSKLNWWKIAALITWAILAIFLAIKITILIQKAKIPIKIT